MLYLAKRKGDRRRTSDSNCDKKGGRLGENERGKGHEEKKIRREMKRYEDVSDDKAEEERGKERRVKEIR